MKAAIISANKILYFFQNFETIQALIIFFEVHILCVCNRVNALLNYYVKVKEFKEILRGKNIFTKKQFFFFS